MSEMICAQVQVGGKLILPEEVVRSLKLKPGDIITFKHAPIEGVTMNKSPSGLKLVSAKERVWGKLK